MNIATPQEQFASRKRLNAIFWAKPKRAKPVFVPDPLAPRCDWPAKRDWLIVSKPQDVSISSILDAVSQYYQVAITEIKSERRSNRVVLARQVACSLARDLTAKSFPVIGREIGGRDHTTVLHSCRKIDRLSKTDGEVFKALSVLRAKLMEEVAG